MALDMSQQAALRAVLTLVERERERQEAKFPNQHLPDGTGGGTGMQEIAYRAKLLSAAIVAGVAVAAPLREMAEHFGNVTYDDHVRMHIEAGTVPLTKGEWDEVMDR